ncbi:MAG: protein O-mannosyl-transferase family [Candidatus Zixiibacteriota bacterium]
MHVNKNFDRTNAVLAGLVFLVSFVVYALTVQRSISFWDCGEFVACSFILGIPHPPGTPLFILLGRIFSIIPFVEDISYRVNYLSVISSSLTAMFSYLLTVRIVGYFFEDKDNPLNRIIAYIGGITGAFFVAFSETNWGNSVEAEVYGLSLALMVMLVWLSLRYFEERGTMKASRTMILAFYLALLGVGVHLTVYLVMPICAIFFILKENAVPRDWFLICAYIILELLLIIVFANGRGGVDAFYLATAFLTLALMVMLYKKINWAFVVAVGTVSSIMIGFEVFMIIMPFGFLGLIVLGLLSRKYRWGLRWKTAIAILIVAVVGFSVHMYIPVRSALNPRIDENNPSRDFRTFINFLDRKQYGQESMVDRMFERRGEWANQFGRHPHMGFWSYFEEQYSQPGVMFSVLLVLGLLGLYVAIRKRMEIGMPFLALFLICSAGLVLYMNFADGTRYDLNYGNEYLEVRNRDYFFTPAFVFFGICIGMGIAGLLTLIKEQLAKSRPVVQKTFVYASSVLVLLPSVSLANNYYTCDRSRNYMPYIYAANILNTCDKDAILFTSGDNDTFPVWCLQEVYNYRKDIRVVNLSLLNTDWYVHQMKHRYNVPISLTDEQILWHPYEYQPGISFGRALKKFYDRPRKRMTYLQAIAPDGILTRDMMVDEIVIENRWQVPIYFSSPPAESPLNLRDKINMVGVLYKLEREPLPGQIDTDKGYDLFMNTYEYSSLNSPQVYKDDNATGLFTLMGSRAIQLYDELLKQGKRDRAVALLEKMTEVYPEYWQSFYLMATLFESEGDSTKAKELLQQANDTLEAYVRRDEKNDGYVQSLGLIKSEIGRRQNDTLMLDEAVDLLWRGFRYNRNNLIGFRNLVSVLAYLGRFSEMQQAALEIAPYKQNYSDPVLQRILSSMQPQPADRPAVPGG